MQNKRKSVSSISFCKKDLEHNKTKEKRKIADAQILDSKTRQKDIKQNDTSKLDFIASITFLFLKGSGPLLDQKVAVLQKKDRSTLVLLLSETISLISPK